MDTTHATTMVQTGTDLLLVGLRETALNKLNSDYTIFVTHINWIYEDLCIRRRYEGRGQVITPTIPVGCNYLPQSLISWYVYRTVVHCPRCDNNLSKHNKVSTLWKCFAATDCIFKCLEDFFSDDRAYVSCVIHLCVGYYLTCVTFFTHD